MQIHIVQIVRLQNMIIHDGLLQIWDMADSPRIKNPDNLFNYCKSHDDLWWN